MLAVGDRAPEFAAIDTEGRPIRLSDFAGGTLVLYFYPKDNTSGCTAQACDFRDRQAEFAAAGATVLGVSRDSARSHQSFTARHELPFNLVADVEDTVCRAYGVVQEKSMYGRTFLGIVRTTYVIDGEGVVRAVFPKVKVKGHADAVLAAVREQAA